MKGKRYLIETDKGLKVIGYQEYTRNINRGIEMKYLGTLQHTLSKVTPPSNKPKLKNKERIMELFDKNISLIANKGHKNCRENFKKLVYNKL